MQPHVSAFNKPGPATAFIALLLALLGLADFTAASMTEDIALEYWGSQIPVRLMFLFGVTGYTYFFKPAGLEAARQTVYRRGPGDDLKNSLVFTWGFLELVVWFWVSAVVWGFLRRTRGEGHANIGQAFLRIRDDRRQAAIRKLQKRQMSEEML